MVRIGDGAVAPDGVLVVDKPPGKTSHDIVQNARRLFRTRAVGHAGTLDPMATGVLLLLFGEACKLSSYLSGADKAYRAEVRFGTSTRSLDAEGEVLDSVELSPGWLSEQELDRALLQERGRRLQVPPNVSAIQTGGERAHARVRRGEDFELPAREVELSSLELKSRTEETLELELSVSKGYYVRSLARDLGLALGVPAHLSALRRTRSGDFRIDEALAWPPDHVPPLISVRDAATRALPVTRLEDEAVAMARQGKLLQGDQAHADRLELVSAWLSPAGDLVALGVSHADGSHRVARGFRPSFSESTNVDLA
jgi:tRNA pseudouridine55 synthase